MQIRRSEPVSQRARLRGKHECNRPAVADLIADGVQPPVVFFSRQRGVTDDRSNDAWPSMWAASPIILVGLMVPIISRAWSRLIIIVSGDRPPRFAARLFFSWPRGFDGSTGWLVDLG